MKKQLLILCFLFLITEVNAAIVDTIKVISPSMNKNIKTCVIMPVGYQAKGKPYPVLYLLHGYSGDYKNWVNRYPVIKELSDQYGMLIVCPDGGYSSWYFDSPVDTTFRYETFLIKELIEKIDGDFNTLKSPVGRAISGISMGGHGALYLAFRHPDQFGAAGSMSGGVDIRPFRDQWDISKRLGNIDQYPGNWEKNTVINLVDRIMNSNLAIIFDCGTEDFFINVNRQLHQKMLDLKIPHDYIERPGAHNREYWNNSIQYQTLFFHNFFLKNK
jgi:S-formylglutathione hydrolase FrmB